MKKYGITEVARLFGITPEAIRKYEDKGIVESSRNDQNDYREYTTWEISTIMQARMYTQKGFTVAQASKMLNTEQTDLITHSIRNRCDELAQEIIQRQRILKALNRERKEIEAFHAAGANEILVELRPELTWSQLYDESSLVEDAQKIEKVRRWMDYLPYASIGLNYDRDSILARSDSLVTGLFVFTEDAQAYGLDNLPYDRRIPEQLCLYTYITGTLNRPMDSSFFESTFAYMRDKGYELTGDIFAQVIYSHRHGGEYYFHHKVWFPIGQ